MVILPWYEEADFAELLALCDHPVHPKNSYQVWYRNAMQSIDDLLRAGNAIEIVTIRPAAYGAWLGGREDRPQLRHRYVEYLATGDGAGPAKAA